MQTHADPCGRRAISTSTHSHASLPFSTQVVEAMTGLLGLVSLQLSSVLRSHTAEHAR